MIRAVRLSFLPFTLLLAYGIVFSWSVFSHGLLVYDDHPGQFVRLWQGLESLRHGAWTADWHREWFAGYPELQFYPPGFVILGLLLHGITGGALNLETVYQIFLGVIYLLPGLTTFALLNALTRSPWAALPPAFLALTLSAGVPSGVEEGVRWGMIGARLGLGLLPLLALSLLPWARDGRSPIWAPPLLAAILLAHPYFFVPAMLLVVLVAVARGWSETRWKRAAFQASASIVIGLGLAAFWLLPLFFRASYTLPMAWSHGAVTALFSRPIVLVLLLLYGLGAVVTLRRRSEVWPLRAALAALPPALLLVMWLNRLVLVERLGFLGLDPDRLRDGVVYGFLWTGGLGWAWVKRRLWGERAWWVSLAAAVLLAVIPQNSQNPDLTLLPVRQPWPTMREVDGQHQLPVLREALRSAPPGRILFSSSSIRLEDGDAWYLPHTHLPAMIPIQIDREIVNGTFTHPSPIAGLVYTGSARPRGVLRLAEELDGRQLFGQPAQELSPARLEFLLRRLKVSTVVVPKRERSLIESLERSDVFELGVEVGSFHLFSRSESTEMPTWQDRRTLQLVVPDSRDGWVETGLFAYPLWSASLPTGPLPTRENSERLLEVFVPPGKDRVVTLRYREGPAEWSGVALTLISLAGWAFVALRTPRGH